MADGGEFTVTCPIPIADYPEVLLAHGGGGRLMAQLIEGMFVPAFDNPHLDQLHDGAVFDMGVGRQAFATDSYVVQPLFFPGGDIGTLAVNGTVNDLAMCGARPQYLSVGMILEEGLPMETLWRVVTSMGKTAADAGVALVTGDTKVVDRGKGDGVFINTAGVGTVADGVDIGAGRVSAGDMVLLSGDIGRHGIAIMAERQGLAFETTVESDCACLAGVVGDLLAGDIDIHCLRDLTRGGLASALVEIVEIAGRQIELDESAIPVGDQVRGACEILGLDPCHVANEGRFVAFVASDAADEALRIMRFHSVCENAVAIGQVSAEARALVTVKTAIGSRRILDRLSGEQLPRIC